jgi:hypothetical protein
MSIRAFSFGGGTQSMAALVLAAEGKLDYRLFLFANVGEDSEYPGTLTYLREYAEPFAVLHGLELVEVQKKTRDGEAQTLLQRINGSPSSIPIPMRLGDEGAPGNRACTAEFKVRVVEKELRRRGATKEDKALVGIGITTDEPGRIGSEVDPRTEYQLRRYPLIDLDLSRADCQQIILSADLPLPPRSACWFCPLHGAEEWKRLARRDPELFARACELENELRGRAEEHHDTTAHMSRKLIPLELLFDGNETVLFDDDDAGMHAGCDSGSCMT